MLAYKLKWLMGILGAGDMRFATSSPRVVASISDPPFLRWSVSKLHFGTLVPFGPEGPLRYEEASGVHTISIVSGQPQQASAWPQLF